MPLAGCASGGFMVLLAGNSIARTAAAAGCGASDATMMIDSPPLCASNMRAWAASLWVGCGNGGATGYARHAWLGCGCGCDGAVGCCDGAAGMTLQLVETGLWARLLMQSCL